DGTAGGRLVGRAGAAAAGFRHAPANVARVSKIAVDSERFRQSALRGGDADLTACLPLPTAIARSNRLKCGINALKDRFVPPGAQAFAANAVFEGSVLRQNVQRKSTQRRYHFRSCSTPDSARVLCKNDIENIVLAALDRPMVEQQLVQPTDTRCQSADEEGHFIDFFPLPLPV